MADPSPRSRFISNREDETLRLEELLDTLNSAPSQFGDERHAPKVDRDRLRALARHQVSEAEARELYSLIHSFQSWSDAFTSALVEEFPQTDEDEPSLGES